MFFCYRRTVHGKNLYHTLLTELTVLAILTIPTVETVLTVWTVLAVWTVLTVWIVLAVWIVLTVLTEITENLKKVSLTHLLTHLLTDNLKARDASASKKKEQKWPETRNDTGKCRM